METGPTVENVKRPLKWQDSTTVCVREELKDYIHSCHSGRNFLELALVIDQIESGGANSSTVSALLTSPVPQCCNFHLVFLRSVSLP